MNYLAIDTANEYMTILAVKDDVVTSSFLPDCAMRHSVAIMNEVDKVLKQAELELSDCDFFAAVVGAGSFTGIRIGVSAVKGLCLAAEKPSLPITSFELAAYNALDSENKVLCLINAGHDCYYACGYEQGGTVVFPPAYLTETKVLEKRAEGFALVALGKENTILPIAEKTEVKFLNPVAGLKTAVERKAKENAFGELAAVYVRKSSAELNLSKKA